MEDKYLNKYVPREAFVLHLSHRNHREKAFIAACNNSWDESSNAPVFTMNICRKAEEL